MTFKDQIIRAIRQNNMAALRSILEQLRFRHGMTYANMSEFLGRCTGLDKANIDQLLREIEN